MTTLSRDSSRRTVSLGLVLLMLVGLLLTSACDEIMSEAKPKVYGLEGSHDTRVINGEFDYGLTLTFTVRNEGKAGVVVISPRLSSSEGEWQRRQKITLGAGQDQRFEYFFHEPTVNATNLYYAVDVIP